jgi:hypothetical protein
VPEQVAAHLHGFRLALSTFAADTPAPRVSEAVERMEERLDEILAVQQDGCPPEELERHLAVIADILHPCLEECLAPEERKTLLRECRAELKHHRQNLPAEMYEKILRNLFLKKLKERFRIPDLSLLNLP